MSTGKQCKSLLLGCGMLVTCLVYGGHRAVTVAQAADRARWCFAPLAVSAMHRVTTDSTRRQTPTSKRAPSRHHRHQWLNGRAMDDNEWQCLRQPYSSTVFLAARKSRTLEPLAFDKKSTFDFFAFFMRTKRASLYTHKESRSIKTALFIESKRFQRPRGRYFFRYLFKFRPAFLIQFWKFVWSFPAKL